MTIQSSVQIGDVIRNAVVFNVKNWLGGTMNSDSLIQSVQDFFAVLEERKIDYVLVGGIAILHYVEGRNTQDLDLLMAVSSLERLPELKATSQDKYFMRANYGELQKNEVGDIIDKACDGADDLIGSGITQIHPAPLSA